MKLFTALALLATTAASAATDNAATPARLLRQNGSTADLVEAVDTVTDVAVQADADKKVRIEYFVKNCCPNCHLSHMFERHYCSHDHVHPLHLSLYTAPTQWIEDRRFLRDCDARRMSWYGWRSIAGEVQ